MKLLPFSRGVLLLLLGGLSAQAQVAPQLAQERIRFNYASTNGVPISQTLDRSIGSDGRAPTASQQSAVGQTAIPPTVGQFQSMAAFSGAVVSTNRSALSANFAQNAINTDLPRAGSGVGLIVLTRAQIGTPFYGQLASLQFGQVIAVPSTDENTNLLSASGILPTAYWLPEPYSLNNHANASYYWSANAGLVFAHKAGPVTVIWKKAQSSTTKPADYDLNPANYSLESGNYYRLFTVQYVVSGTAIQKPRKLYWTESVMSDKGVRVPVNDHSISAIFAYNNNFPGAVASQYLFPGQETPAAGTGETHTIWFDQQLNMIRAYNVEGRILMELAGDVKSDGNRRQFLGIEIIDVIREPTPTEVTLELGDRVSPYQSAAQDFSALVPNIAPSSSTSEFMDQVYQGNAQNLLLFAKKDTRNQNDALVHWLTTGLQGLQWPELLVRYRLVWPADPAKYAHYVRPPALTEEMAKLTAVPLPQANNPQILYQDDEAHPRAHTTPQFSFYTWLKSDYPAHRTLLKYVAGDNVYFERVFSWLDQSLLANNFSSSVATNLSNWDPVNNVFLATPDRMMPTVVRQTVNVGDRINPPTGELGSNPLDGYWAGTIVNGTCYDPTAYSDPLANGFPAATNSAIIPVNAIPQASTLEVLWYRQNKADPNKGFDATYWPSAVGSYTVQWPANASEIVLASNAGSGLLDSLQAVGTIYYQNDPGLVGYNPNEEHALMVAGKAYALRDDLNITNAVGFSSQPFVLLRYVAGDGRPAIRPFKVRREAPERGIVFDYVTEAGHILQAPMPLPLLGPPVEGSGISAKNVNKPRSSNPPANWVDAEFVNQYAIYRDFTYLDRKNNYWVYRGLHEEPNLEAGTYDATTHAFSADMIGVAAPGNPFTFTIHASHRSSSLELLPVTALPAWLSITRGVVYTSAKYNALTTNGYALTLVGTPPPNEPLGTRNLSFIISNIVTRATVPVTLHLTVSPSPGAIQQQAPLELTYPNGPGGIDVTYLDRPPFLAQAANQNNSFTMQFYYATQPGFAWPNGNAPAVGTVVPYLRPRAGDGSFVGNGRSSSDASLEIVYRPVWPDHDPLDPTRPLPTLHYGKTATVPQNGFPAIRGQSSLKSLYQQSLAVGALPDTRQYYLVRHYSKTEDVYKVTTTGKGKKAKTVKTKVGTKTTNWDEAYGPHDLAGWAAYQSANGSKENFAADEQLDWAYRGTATGQNYDWQFRGTFANFQAAPKSADDARRTRPSVVLFDPTKAVSVPWSLPGNVQTEDYQGRTYFPGLPPGIQKRLYFVQNDEASADSTKETGTLTFEGRFVDPGAGDPYLQLNLMSPSEVQDAKTNVPELAEAFSHFAGRVKEITDDSTPVDSYALSATGPGNGFVTLIAGDSRTLANQDDPVLMYVIRVGGPLESGEVKPLPSDNPLSESVTFLHTLDLGSHADEFEFQWLIAPPKDGAPLIVTNEASGVSAMLALGWQPAASGQDKSTFNLGGSGIRVLADNYVTVRYRPVRESHPLHGQWSSWTAPALAEGWIKRVLAGINPFNQRTADLFNNRVNTDVSLLTQAGHRWEGDVALNSDSLDNYGLLEIYETVLRRGQGLSINAPQPINYGPANDALLLAAGYINNLYMLIGDEARADAANPTIGIGTKDRTYGDVATSLFSFQGQEPSLLEEELALLRGRSDFLQPAVSTPPYYNRLVWNYTRGINAGEVIYALNYDIQDKNLDGVVDANDAAVMFPQGHGDAYGHYLTALTGFYSLLMNNNFDWVPASEAVNVLGVAVQVGYQHEREFAAAAAAVARTGKQVVDLSWRKDYQGRDGAGWESFASANANSRTGRTEYWGSDHWAARTGQGAYINWLAGNAILPATDGNPNHTGIQIIDRTTVPELQELPAIAADLQTTMDSINAGATPIGLPKDSVPFDLNPNQVVGGENGAHFEQIYTRAKVALNNAVAAFDDAKDVTRLMRSEQDSLTDYSAGIAKQELAYTNMLVEVYGSPYPDDIGVGKTYVQGYAGPDIAHYAYIDDTEFSSKDGSQFASDQPHDFNIPLKNFPSWWGTSNYLGQISGVNGNGNPNDNAHTLTNAIQIGVTFNDSTVKYHYEGAALLKPPAWTTPRVSPGKIQAAAANVLRRKHELFESLTAADRAVLEAKAEIGQVQMMADSIVNIVAHKRKIETTEVDIGASELAYDAIHLLAGGIESRALRIYAVGEAAVPEQSILGTSFSVPVGTLVKPLSRAALFATLGIAGSIDTTAKIATSIAISQYKNIIRQNLLSEDVVESALRLSDRLDQVTPYIDKIQDNLDVIQSRLRDLDDANREYSAAVASGERIQAEREQFRRAAAAVVQGFRTRDAAFRLFRDEKLERYKTLFDLSARYAFLAAQAYDYETGLLGTTQGRSFISSIIQSRALGVIQNGEPQFAGSNSGDPGLSSALAEMHADWDVIKGRLGFNNPDAYGTTVSLRAENFRILPDGSGDANWADVLQRGRMANILADEDVRRMCMQINKGDGLPVPGIVLSFSTVIANGLNLFGQPLAAGDHAYSPSSFATKIFAAGVALEGYRGMDNPAANVGAVNGAGGTSPVDPNVTFLDPTAMSATPYIYLIPVGLDSMRTPPLGDISDIRTWTVDDVSIPMPFNIGGSTYSISQPWQSGSTLSEPLFSVRKHQAFRPVSSASYFASSIYTGTGGLQRSQYTNNRLIGRSVWNSKWKLVIPGSTLLNDPNDGLDRFMKSVKDIKLNFVTYSYSGN